MQQADGSEPSAKKKNQRGKKLPYAAHTPFFSQLQDSDAPGCITGSKCGAAGAAHVRK
jgi:hypothetical protein